MNSTMVIPILKAPRKLAWWVVPGAMAVLLAGGAWMYNPWKGGRSAEITGQFYTVVPHDLEVKINKDGELHAITYTDVKSEVESASQIIELVPEGTYVNRGDVLVKLDASNLQTRKENIDLDIRKAESSLTVAMEWKGIQENQNATNLEAAEVVLKLAELDVEQYIKGTYKQSRDNANTALKMANINLKNAQEELDQTKALFGRGFVTAADVKKSELAVTVAENELAKATTALEVLEKYSHPMEVTRLQSALAQAEQRRNRVVRENRSLLSQREAELEEKRESLAMLKRQQAKLDEQIKNCTIRAPQDGLVIYASSIERNQRELVQEGTTVRQSQWLIRLPDVKHMKAVLKIQEAQKPKLDETRGQRALVKILGVSEPVGATLTKVSVLPDNSQRWWNPDLREYPVELTLDRTPPGLKPGIRVESCEIFIDRIENALAVPLASIYTVGRESYLFVKHGDSVKERKVRLGTANETDVQVTHGLEPGELVLLLQAGQGRQLLERAGIKLAEVTPQRPMEREKVPEEPKPAKPAEEAGRTRREAVGSTVEVAR